MAEKTKRGAKEGIAFGLLAGVVFALVEIVVSAAMGNPPLMPVRMFASIVLGQSAMMGSLGTAIVVGVVLHLILSAAYGLAYGLFNARLPSRTETSWGHQFGIGLAFGALLWLVNFHIFAPLFFPWFLGAPQLLQLILHAVFFGLPLALMYAGAERRVQHVRTAPGHL